ncbi:MAG: MFS transporter, partial [Erysipelotrichaceae bacterium]
MIEKKERYYYIYYFVLYISFGLFFPYVNAYYNRIGLNGKEIGFIASTSVIIAMIFVPFWGYLADRYSKKGVLSFLFIFTIISVFLWKLQTQFIYICLVSMLVSVFKSDLSSISDSITVSYCEKSKLEFGTIRVFGSLGYIVGSTFISGLLSYLGYNGPFVVIYILSLVVSLTILFQLPQYHSTKNKDHNKISYKTILSNKVYLFVVSFSLLSILVVDTLMAYSGIHLVNSLNSSEAYIGVYVFMMVIPELFIVRYASRIIKKIGYYQAYIISALSVILRCLICYLTSNVYVFLLAQS